MPFIDTRFVAHCRGRFTRPDAYRYLKPATQLVEEPNEDLCERAALRCDLAGMKDSLNAIRQALAESKYLVAGKYSPDQPRIPAGEPGGGRWTVEPTYPAMIHMLSPMRRPMAAHPKYNTRRMKALLGIKSTCCKRKVLEAIPLRVTSARTRKHSRRMCDDQSKRKMIQGWRTSGQDRFPRLKLRIGLSIRR